jgi:hypothetical protein
MKHKLSIDNEYLTIYENNMEANFIKVYDKWETIGGFFNGRNYAFDEGMLRPQGKGKTSDDNWKTMLEFIQKAEKYITNKGV